MKNVSLFIARRYNTYTLLISMALILISSLMVGTLIYSGNLSLKIIRDLLFPEQILSNNQQILIVVLMLGYLLIQTTAIYLLFNKLLKSIPKNYKLGIAFLIAFISLGTAGFLIFKNLNQSIGINALNLVLISTGLLSIIFGLLNYIFSKRKITGVNIITSIAVFAITIATCALFVILSVFSGLEKMNIQFFSNVNPDLKISPSKGKTLTDLEVITAKLDKKPQVLSYSKVIEEKVSVEFENKQDIAYIKGIDKNYTNVVKVDTCIVHGSFLSFENPNEILASDGIARRLQMYIDHQHASLLRMPKPGTGLISSENEAFNTALANPVGIFIINDQYDKYIYSPLELTQNLLELPPNSAYSIEIKLQPGLNLNTAKSALQNDLGNSVLVQTRQDLDSTFLKVMNVENLIIYLIFTLVIIIATFNLAGAIIIIILDKKTQIKTMWSFGMRLSQIKRIFFQTGLLITVFSILFGLGLGSALGILQNQFHLVMANAFVAFPFEFTLTNYFTVILTVFCIGGFVSWMVSRKLPV
ncbi:ABC transporter permease [Moheibacter lacus]|uniref:ABC transporter permease n=1 Tax=Moheibacter lacus TaxID=2745851 RepID=A0A838ZLF9_9FLAO|nr:ABC transporter permease [Moheibacter lacus]MBA5628366.1 ABC transporter permease [Moheibacter lacus]